MARYPVYLEVAPDGRCMVHVLDLPGCIVRAPSRAEALRQVPGAIRDHCAWLQRHGEPASMVEEPIEVEVTGESAGAGPFDRGDTAALLPHERQPIAPEEMERYLRLAAYARTDLLALVGDLPDEVLDWQPDPQSFSLRLLLRHVGNADEFYVSRIVPPETLPPEWEHDEGLPIFEFLEMERRTAVARLRQLGEEERSAIFYPTRWTRHPEEPWTARKALRRFLEHEQEHIGQVQEILAAWRADLPARLAAAREELLAAAALVPPEERATRPVCGEWTLKDVLAHVTDWERMGVEGLRDMAAGQPPRVGHVEDIEAWNRAHYQARRDEPWETVWADLHAVRASLVEILDGMSQADLARAFPLPWGQEGTAYDWLSIYLAHDREHAQGIRSTLG